MIAHRKTASPLYALWLTTALALCPSMGTQAAAAPHPTALPSGGKTAPISPAVASLYRDLEGQLHDTSTVICTTTAAILSDYLLEQGALSQDALPEFQEKAHQDCDYAANYHKALATDIGYRAKLAEYLGADADEQRATKRQEGLDSITNLTAQELCVAGRQLTQSLGLSVDRTTYKLCSTHPVEGALYFIQASGLTVWQKERIPAPPQEATASAETRPTPSQP